MTTDDNQHSSSSNVQCHTTQWITNNKNHTRQWVVNMKHTRWWVTRNNDNSRQWSILSVTSCYNCLRIVSHTARTIFRPIYFVIFVYNNWKRMGYYQLWWRYCNKNVTVVCKHTASIDLKRLELTLAVKNMNFHVDNIYHSSDERIISVGLNDV